MKKILFSLVILLGFGFSAQAQKACCSKKGDTASAKECASKKDETTKVASYYMEADKLAEADPAIQKRVCVDTGAVGYFHKSKCAASGKITFEEVEFNADKKAFTRVASASMEKVIEVEAAKVDAINKKSTETKKACCSDKSKAECKKKEGSK